MSTGRVCDTDQMWIFQLFEYRDVVELDVEILVYAFECASYRDVVLQFDGHLVVDQSLEKAAELSQPGLRRFNAITDNRWWILT